MSFVTAGTTIAAQHLTACNAIRSAGKNTALHDESVRRRQSRFAWHQWRVDAPNLCLDDQCHVTPLFPRLVRQVFRVPAGLENTIATVVSQAE
jgi:hypothetical protein